MKYSPSPNFNDRATGIKLDYIVLHYTGMKDEKSAVERMRDPKTEVSAHYVIGEDGDLIQLVSETHRAWHAGKSFWRGITDINSASIGIELVNPGHEFGYRAFPQAQIDRLKQLLNEIIARHKMNPTPCLLAHSDIAPARKQDPGELFPWQELAATGFGLWPRPGTEDYELIEKADIKVLLSAIGYEISSPADSLGAFQRRFYPENLTGNADKETIARLRAVVRGVRQTS